MVVSIKQKKHYYSLVWGKWSKIILNQFFIYVINNTSKAKENYSWSQSIPQWWKLQSKDTFLMDSSFRCIKVNY